MDALLNGVTTTPNAYGVITGTNGTDRISGTNGNDKLAGGKGVDYLYGSAGNDAFLFNVTDFDAGLGNGVQDFVYDFHGAGTYLAGNNDFLAFVNFGVGSTLTLDATRTALAELYTGDDTLHFYTIHSTATGQDYKIFVHSLNGETLDAGDYAFYG